MTASPRLAVSTALIAPLLALGLHARAEDGYQVTALQSLGEPGSWAWDINDAGQTVGHAQTAPQPIPGTGLWVSNAHAAIWQNGSAAALGTLPGGTLSIAHGINDAGQAVGRSRSGTTGPASAFMWDGDAMTPLATPEGHESEAFAISGAGQAAGSIMVEGGSPLADAVAVRWDGGAMIPLATLAGWNASSALAINSAGAAVGWATTGPGFKQAVLWQDGQAIELSPLDEAPFSTASAINESGTAVGSCGYEWTTGNWAHRAVRWSDGQALDLGTLGGNSSKASDVNDNGLIVGTAATDSAGEHAFVWDGQQMTDLNDLIAPGSGWELLEATGINNLGQIVGFGLFQGEVHAFRLDPILQQPCPGDTNDDGMVDTSDLVAVITGWGSCTAGPCAADVTDDALVDTDDLITVFTQWGNCP